MSSPLQSGRSSIKAGEADAFSNQGVGRSKPFTEHVEESGATQRIHTVVDRDEEHRIKRGLSLSSLLGLAFMVCNSWAAVAGVLSIGLAQGGSVTLLYGIILISAVVFCVVCSLAELASIYPTAGGQYHWAGVLSPAKYKRGISYTTGFINMAGWMIIVASNCLILAQIIMALVVYYQPDFKPKSWQLFLLYQATNVVWSFWVGYGLHKTPYMQIGLAWSLCLFAVTLIGNLAGPGSRGNYNSAKDVWGTFSNSVGWESNAVVFMTGLANPNYGFLGLDGAIHMAEDSQNPARDIPRVLLATVAIGFTSAFCWLMATFYSIQDFTVVAAPPTGFPLLEVLNQTLVNKAAVTFVMALYFVNTGFGTTGCFECSARLTWAFAMDNALVGSKWLSRLNHNYNTSLYAIATNTFFVFLIGCLYLASSAVYNAIVGCALILSYTTFAIPVLLLLCNKRQFAWRPSFYLGAFGWFVNAVTVFWALFISVVYCIPAFKPITASNMNYACVVLPIIALLGCLNWFFWAKKHFKLPQFVIETDQNMELNPPAKA